MGNELFQAERNLYTAAGDSAPRIAKLYKHPTGVSSDQQTVCSATPSIMPGSQSGLEVREPAERTRLGGGAHIAGSYNLVSVASDGRIINCLIQNTNQQVS